MKILVSTPTLYHPDFPHSPNTGFGIMVSCIAEALGKAGQKVYVNNSSFFGPSSERLGYHLLQRRLRVLLFSSRIKDVVRGFRYAFLARTESWWTRYNIFKYYVSIGYNERVIRQVVPDHIHINGLTLSTLPFLVAAVRTGVPFTVTLHGLNSLDDSVALSPFLKAYEFRMLRLLLENQVQVSIVSSGGFRKIVNRFGGKHYPTLNVVLNSVSPIRRSYPDVPRKKRILCVGNIDRRKNQAQLVRAVALLKDRTDFDVFFIGNDNLNGEVQLLAQRLGVSDRCHFTGTLPHEEVFSMMNEAWCTCLLSKDEGFGLSFIEGYCFGLPAICFADIDAVSDISDERCTLLVEERTDEAVSWAISSVFDRDWDRDYIRLFSRRFSPDILSDAYLSLFKAAPAASLTEQEICRLMDDYMALGWSKKCFEKAAPVC